MRIAIVNKFFFLNGGQETVALEQMKLLQQAGQEVAFFAMHHPRNPANYPWARYFVDYADFSLKNTQQGWIQKLSIGSRFIHNKQAADRFSAFLDAFKPDIIHCHGIAHQLTYAILPEAKKRKIPVVQTLHDYQAICPSYTLLKGDGSLCTQGCHSPNYLPCIQNTCVKNSRLASTLSAVEMAINRGLFDYIHYIDSFISPSQFLAQKVLEAGIPKERIQVIPNFLVGLEEIEPSQQHQDYYLYSGRLSSEKGLMTLLKAFRQVPRAQLRIAGEGMLKSQIETYIADHQMKNVTMLGYLQQDELHVQLMNATALILPSIWYENQPMSIIEAFAAGKPVIASNLGGIPEMVIDGENGFLFPPGNEEALARLINRFQSTPDPLSLAGCKARTDALSRYGTTRHLNSLMALYGTLLESTSPSSLNTTVIKATLATP
jgi:glycosyltransferase involved in cell wall biosynthesis